MIYLGGVLLAVSLFLLFDSADALDFARALKRVLLAVLLIIYDRFSDQGVQETAVLFYAVWILLLLAVLRKEVQADHVGD